MTDGVVGQTIVGYHGCDIKIGSKIIDGEVAHLKPSKNPYDWLGDGIYFFEDDLLRAQVFAQATAAAPGKKLTAQPITYPYAIGAVIRLGNCLDLSKQSGIDELIKAHAALERGKGPDQELPINKRAGEQDEEGILHNLDRAVINYLHGRRIADGRTPYDTVRGLFHQGKPAFATSAIGKLSHVQIAVRNASCILGYFHPQSPLADPFQGLNKLPNSPYRKKKTTARKL
jgi:hypothetical protein